MDDAFRFGPANGYDNDEATTLFATMTGTTAGGYGYYGRGITYSYFLVASVHYSTYLSNNKQSCF